MGSGFRKRKQNLSKDTTGGHMFRFKVQTLIYWENIPSLWELNGCMGEEGGLKEKCMV